MKWKNVKWMQMLLGAAGAAGISGTLCAAAAVMLDRQWLAVAQLPWAAAGILAIASLGAGFISGGSCEALGTGILFWLMLAGIHIIFYETGLDGVGKSMASVIVGSGTAALFWSRKKSTRGRRRKARIVNLNKKLH